MGVPGTKSNVKNNVELRHHTTMQVEPCGHFIIIIEWGMRQKTWVILHHYLHEFAFLCLQVNKNQMESNVTIQLVYPIISNSIISPIFTKVSSGFPFYSLQQSAKAWGIKRKKLPSSLLDHTISPDDTSSLQRAAYSHHLSDQFPDHGVSPREKAYYSAANAAGWIRSV